MPFMNEMHPGVLILEFTAGEVPAPACGSAVPRAKRGYSRYRSIFVTMGLMQGEMINQ